MGTVTVGGGDGCEPEIDLFLTKVVEKRMLADGKGGKVINIASLLSFHAGIRIRSCTASNTELAGLTQLIAKPERSSTSAGPCAKTT